MSTKNYSTQLSSKQLNKQFNAPRSSSQRNSNPNPAPLAFRAPRTVRAGSQKTQSGWQASQTVLLGAINGSVGLSTNKFVINPGLESTFHRLALSARTWEEYQFRNVKFEFRSGAPYTTSGHVHLAPDFDPEDPAPTTLEALSTYYLSANNRATENVVVRLPNTNDVTKPRFVRTSSKGHSLKLYDLLNFYVITSGQADTTEIGLLYMTYEVKFSKAQTIISGVPAGESSTVLGITSDQNIPTSGAALVANVATINDGLGIIISNTAGQLVLSRGAYILSGAMTFTDSAAEALTCTVRCYINGAAMSPPQHMALAQSTCVASSYNSVNFQYYITVEETDTVEINVVCTGAAGTLGLAAGYSPLHITVA